MPSLEFEAFSLLIGENASLNQVLQDHSTRHSYAKGETILHHRDESTDVHVVLEGYAKAYLLSVEGREVWLNEFRRGAMFGEMAAISGAPRVCSIGAFTEVETAVFRGQTFLDLMRDHGELGLIVSKLLASRLNRTSQRLYLTSAESLDGRVVIELLECALPIEDGSEFTHVIRPVPVIAEIARKVGAARESVSRVISALSRANYLSREQAEWKLKAPETLLNVVS